MIGETKSFEQRIKENIKNYRLDHFLTKECLKDYLMSISALEDIDFYVTDRHGDAFVVIGEFPGFIPDVVKKPGKKIRACNRTLGHIYTRMDRVKEGRAGLAQELVSQTVHMLSMLVEEAYLHRECSYYVDELEEQIGRERQGAIHSGKEDPLTRVCNKLYFEERMRVLDRSETAPVALINGNINDCKYALDHFGELESDRLITLIAAILKDEAKNDYIIGRCDGDVFNILIPVPEDGEAEGFCQRVQKRCLEIDDPVLSPSIAFGIVYKTNVEQALSSLISDAEYAMLANKLELKNAPGYQERLHREQ